jgi:hypothetical protein
LTFANYDAATEQALNLLGAERLEMVPMTLEDAFILIWVSEEKRVSFSARSRQALGTLQCRILP